jgi:hypothetical protein
MPDIKNPAREESANQVVPNPNATERAANPGTLTPVVPTDTTDFGVLGWFITDAEGCTVRFGIEQQQYRLGLTLPNYSAMFSQLLACWLNRWKVSLTYRKPLTPPTPAPTASAPTAPPPLSIVSLVGFPTSSSGE